MLSLPKGNFVSSEEWLTHCYSCGRNKFYWNVRKEVGLCHRCKTTVQSLKQLEALYELSRVAPPPSVSSGVAAPPEDLIPVAESELATKYLYSRYMSDDDIRSSGLWYSSGAIYCPISPLSPEYPLAWVRRSISEGGWFVLPGTQKKYYAYGWEQARGNRSVAFVEGVFDAVPNRLGIPTVACLGSAITQPLVDALEVSGIETAYLAFDPDEPGRAATRHFKREAEVLGIKTVDLKLRVEMGDMGPMHPTMRKWRDKIRED